MATRSEELITGFADSALWSIPELFGFDPPEHVIRYRYDNPVGGFASAALGSSIPYLGWYKGAKMIGPFEKMIARIGAGYEGAYPGIAGALKAGVRMAPLEVSRIGINQAWGDSSFGEMLSSSLMNLALEGAVGGVVNATLKGKKIMPKAQDLGEDALHPPQLELRARRAELAMKPPEQHLPIMSRMEALAESVRSEVPIAQTPHLFKLADGKNKNELEPFFRAGVNDELKVQKPSRTGQGSFRTDPEWRQILGDGGVEADGMEDFVRYPRIVTPLSDEAEFLARSRIDHNMVKTADGWSLIKEADDDMFVIAKELKDGKFFFAKTDSPDRFMKKGWQGATRVVDENIWAKQDYDLIKSRGLLADRAIQYLKENPYRVHQMMTSTGRVGKYAKMTFDKAANLLGTTEGLATMKESAAIRDAKLFWNKSMVPRRMQFRGEYQELDFALKQMGDILNDANMLGDDIFKGDVTGQMVGHSLWRRAIAHDKGVTRPNLIETSIDKLDVKSIPKVVDLAKKEPTEGALKRMLTDGSVTKEEFDFLDAVRSAGKKLNEQIKLQKDAWGNLKEAPKYLIPTKLGEGKITTKGHLKQFTSKQVYGAMKRMGVQTIENTMMDQIRMIKLNHPEMFPAFMDRYRDMQSKLRPAAVAQNKILDQMMKPLLGSNSASKISQFTNQRLVEFTLGGIETAFNVVNVLSGPMQAIPEIMVALNARSLGRGDYVTYHPAMGANGPVGTIAIPNPFKIMAGGFRRMRSPDADMNTLWEMGTRDGTLAPRNLEEFAGEGARSMQGVRQAFKDGDYVHGLQSLWLGPMSKSESLARAYTYTTATEAARMAGFTNLDDIHRFAREVTQNSMYMYGQAYRPGLFNNPVGSVMGLFQNWYFNYMGSLLDYVGAGVKHGYWTPLLWQQGSLAAIGGISATPLYGLANAMSEEFSDKNLMRNMYEMMDEEAADGILYGLPAYMLGVAVTPSLAVDPVRSLESIWSPVMYDRMAAMKNTFGMGIDQWARTGVNPLMSEDFRRGLMKTFAPRTLHRIYQSFMDTGIESISTGYPILKNPSVSDKIWYSMGLSPLELAKANREANMLYENKMARRAIISTMGNTYSEAMDRGDSRAMWEVIQAARYQGIDISSVMKSAATRSKKGNTDLLERSADPATKYRLFGAYGLKP